MWYSSILLINIQPHFPDSSDLPPTQTTGPHHASEGQNTKFFGGDLLEQLLMTTAPTAKRYMSMIMRGLCHKPACPV